MSEISSEPHERGELLRRALYMILFAVLYGVAEFVLTALVVIQFVHVLLMGDANQPLLRLGSSLTAYAYQVFAFLTFNSEQRPFPLSDWPADTAEGGPWFESSRQDYSMAESQPGAENRSPDSSVPEDQARRSDEAS